MAELLSSEYHDQNALTALAQSSLVSMILLDHEGKIRFLNEPAKYALPELQAGEEILKFIHTAHQGRIEECLNSITDFSLKLIELRFRKSTQAMIWEVFRLSNSVEVVMVTQETGFANSHKELLSRQQESVFQVLEDGFIEVDLNQNIVLANQTFLEWFESENADAHNIRMFVEEQELNLDFYQKVSFVLKRSVPSEGTCYFHQIGKWCRFELVPRPGRIMMRFIDITEEVKDDHELQIAQIRMLAILDSTEDANLLLSPEGKLLSINRKASEVMMRWLHVHLVEDCDVLDLLKKQKSFDFDLFFQKSLSGEFVSFELKLHSFEGSDNWYSVRLFPAKNPMGVVIGVSFNLTDINTHKVAELQLIETEKKLIALFNSAPEAHIFFDVHGKVRFFNRLVQQLPLYLREPLPVSVGKHLNQLGFLLPETQLEEILALTLKGESTYQLLELANYQDETFWWEIKTYPAIGQQGNLLGAVWRIDNVSENHQSRLEIIERQEQLRELARIHSHEVRKPLANVLALLDMISNQTSVNHKQDDTLRQYLSNQIAELDSIIHHLSSKNTSNSL